MLSSRTLLFPVEAQGSSVCYHNCLLGNLIDSPCFLSVTLPPVKLLMPDHTPLLVSPPHFSSFSSSTFSWCQCSDVVPSVSLLLSKSITVAFPTGFYSWCWLSYHPVITLPLLLPPCQLPPPSSSCWGRSATTTGASPSAWQGTPSPGYSGTTRTNFS